MLKALSLSLFLALTCILALTPGAAAQSLPTLQDHTHDQDQQNQDQSMETLKVQVNVVQLFFNVKDKKGALIPNQTKNDFDLFEDGKPQTIKYFTAESNLPLTLGILIDTSGSQMRVLDMEKEVGGAFLNDILRDKDKEALNRTRINAGHGGGIPGLGGGPVPTSNPRGTLLYDAVYLSAHDQLAHEVGRKAMILLTDGEDQGSQLHIRDAIEAAQKSDSICYVLMIADRGFYGGFGYSGDSEMKKLATETGGRVIEVGNKFDKLKEAFDQIARELRSQYNVGYTPVNNTQDGSFRKIEVRSKQGYKIQTRSGYYAIAHNKD
jgi:hypothetical protein